MSENTPEIDRTYQKRLAELNQQVLELIKDNALGSLAKKIASTARVLTDADAAIVTLFDEQGLVDRQIFTPLNAKITLQLPDSLPLLTKPMNTTEHAEIAGVSEIARQMLVVPIETHKDLQGVVYLLKRRIDVPFSHDDERVVRTYGEYAAVALDNARFYSNLTRRDQTLSRRNENLALLNMLATTLSLAQDADQIAENALTLVMNNLHLAAGQIYLRQEDSPFLHRVQHRGEEMAEIWEKRTYRIGEGAIGTIAETGQYQLINLQQCDRCGLHPSVFENNFYQLACFPMNGRRGVLGVMVVATRYPEPLDEMEIQLLSSIASLIGTAIENVELNLQMRRLDILEERERIGMDLHDGVIQSIYAVGLTLEHARLLMLDNPSTAEPRIEQAIKDLNHTIRDIRAYILDLRPRQLHEENLLQGINRLVVEFKANTLIDVVLEGKAEDLEALPPGNALALFHICQEALANIAKHAHATKVSVTLWTAGDRALLEVIDDGRGFVMQSIRQTIGHGLANMYTRARNVGGEVEISSEPGEGTAVIAWVPYPRELAAPADVAQEAA